jgi:hypothetical protein
MKNRYQEFSKTAHENSVAKGFWPEDKLTMNRPTMVMLMITELSEAIDADRADKRANLAGFEARLQEVKGSFAGEGPTYREHEPELYSKLFKEFIKDSVEDEIADTYVRIFDYAGAFDIKLNDCLCGYTARNLFSENILHVTRMIALAGDGELAEDKKHFEKALNALDEICKVWVPNIEKHIEYKMKYNSYRAWKHNKSY